MGKECMAKCGLALVKSFSWLELKEFVVWMFGFVEFLSFRISKRVTPSSIYYIKMYQDFTAAADSANGPEWQLDAGFVPRRTMVSGSSHMRSGSLVLVYLEHF
jgi:hypothetical protein